MKTNLSNPEYQNSFPSVNTSGYNRDKKTYSLLCLALKK